MYSYEDRIKAVKLYIKLGRRTSATIRQLGYPTKNALKSWFWEYEKRNVLAIGYSRTKSKYSDEQKKVAVEHYLSHGFCIAATARALGYPGTETLRVWIREMHPETTKCVVSKIRSVPRSDELKQTAVIGLCTRQESAQEVAKKLDVDRTTLYKWKNQLLGREAPASMKRQKDSSTNTERAELERQIESLQRDIHQLQLEHDLLKKANEIIKKGLGVDLRLLTNQEKTMLVDALRENYALTVLLSKLDLARSSYFYHRARLQVADKYADVRRTMAEIFEINHRCYGYRRIH